MEDGRAVRMPDLGDTVVYSWAHKGARFEAPGLVTGVPVDGHGEPQPNAAVSMWVMADPSVALLGGWATPVVHRVAVPHLLYAEPDRHHWHDRVS